MGKLKSIRSESASCTAFAHHVSTQMLIDFGQLEIQPRTIQPRIVVRNKNGLVPESGLTVEKGNEQSGGNTISLEIEVQGNPKLVTEANLDSDDFRIAGATGAKTGSQWGQTSVSSLGDAQ